MSLGILRFARQSSISAGCHLVPVLDHGIISCITSKGEFMLAGRELREGI
jgi:hypothetical protein